MIYKGYIGMINVRVGLKTLRIEVLRNAAADKKCRWWQTDGTAEREIAQKRGVLDISFIFSICRQ